MPLIVSFWDDEKAEWRELNTLYPNDLPGSVSDHPIIGGRNLYLFECDADDSHSRFYQSIATTDEDLGAIRRISSDKGFLNVIRVLGDEEVFEKTIITDRMLRTPVKLRFRHVTVDLGTRRCLICQVDIPADQLGVHLIEKHGDEMDRWPEGQNALIKYLRDSIKESLGKSKGFPRYVDSLNLSMTFVNFMDKKHKAGYN